MFAVWSSLEGVLPTMVAHLNSVVSGAEEQRESRVSVPISTGCQPKAIGPTALTSVSGSRPWLPGYRRRIIVSDGVVVLVAMLVAAALRFGPLAGFEHRTGDMPIYAVGAVIVLCWLLMLRLTGSVDRRIFGSGTEEYSRVVMASFAVFGLFAIIEVIFRFGIARGYVAIGFPLGIVGLLLSRWSMRRVLAMRRRHHELLDGVLVVGTPATAADFIHRIEADPVLGYRVVGICLPNEAHLTTDQIEVAGLPVPVFGNFDDVPGAVSRCSANTVAVTSAEALGTAAMNELSWDLERLDVSILVAPGIVDVAGPRMVMRPVAGLPLLHIDKPTYEGANRLRKAGLDRIGAGVILFLTLPLMLAVALAVKLDSRGPVFYGSARIGLNNQPFQMWKFRSMVADADQQRDKLVNYNEGAGPLFKIRDDPRVTRIGRLLRRYSLDELPQLYNVLIGDMSLVGPRPPLPEEVAQYTGAVARRMLVRPGITGLWQISGRSELSWDESVRLDLSYVANWSLMQDLQILWRTARAVVSNVGAY